MIHSSCEQCFHNKHCIIKKDYIDICDKVLFDLMFAPEPIVVFVKCKDMEINIYCSICGKIMFIDSYDGEPIQICERCSGKYGEEREET